MMFPPPEYHDEPEPPPEGRPMRPDSFNGEPKIKCDEPADPLAGISGGFISRQDLQAARICRELQTWISGVEGTSTEPMVALTITDGMTCIEIDRTTVWCSQVDSDDALTFEACQKVFQDEILELTHYGRTEGS